jgi:hypothetical protein
MRLPVCVSVYVRALVRAFVCARACLCVYVCSCGISMCAFRACVLRVRWQVSACGFHSCVLLEEGEVFSWGDGKFGRLGHGSEANVGVPRQIERLRGVRVVQVRACGICVVHSWWVD